MWKPTNLAGTRWLPHIEKALTAVLKNFQPLMTHLQHASEAASASADMTGRAKQSSWGQLLFVHLILDILQTLSKYEYSVDRVNILFMMLTFYSLEFT